MSTSKCPPPWFLCLPALPPMTRGEEVLIHPVKKMPFHKSWTTSRSLAFGCWQPLPQQKFIGYDLAKTPMGFLIASVKMLNYLCLKYMHVSTPCFVTSSPQPSLSATSIPSDWCQKYSCWWNFAYGWQADTSKHEEEPSLGNVGHTWSGCFIVFHWWWFFTVMPWAEHIIGMDTWERVQGLLA